MTTPPKDKGRTPAGCAPSKESNAGTDNTPSNTKASRREKKSPSDVLVTIVTKQAFLFHDSAGNAYVEFWRDSHKEVWPLKSNGFKHWAQTTFYRAMKKTLKKRDLDEAVEVLTGKAIYEGPEEEVWLRVGKDEDDTYYLDLCNAAWQVIELRPTGCRLLDHSPVKFRRTANMGELPVPEESGNLDLLWNSVNIAEADRPLVLAVLMETLRPDTHFPILELVGEQGTGKSDTQERLRSLVDPCSANLRCAPKEREDIFVAAHNNWVVSFNNMSKLSPEMQDALCTISTGGGFATRTFYTNAEETVIEIKRPVFMNGISVLATAADLADRTVRVSLPRFTKRRKGSELKAEFERDRPAILGGFLALFCETLLHLPVVEEIDDLPRMGDFAELGEAMFLSQDRSDSFVTLYGKKLKDAAFSAIQDSPVADAVLSFAREEDCWTGTYKELKSLLEKDKPYNKKWPDSEKSFADELRRAAPVLSKFGVQIETDPNHKRDGYHVTLTYFPDEE